MDDSARSEIAGAGIALFLFAAGFGVVIWWIAEKWPG